MRRPRRQDPESCGHGHPWTETTRYWFRKDGTKRRVCLICERARTSAKTARQVERRRQQQEGHHLLKCLLAHEKARRCQESQDSPTRAGKTPPAPAAPPKEPPWQ